MKPVIPGGIFKLMIVLKRYYCLYFSSLHDEIHRTLKKLIFIFKFHTLLV